MPLRLELLILLIAAPLYASPWELPAGNWQSESGDLRLHALPSNRLSVGAQSGSSILEYEITGYRLGTYFLRVKEKTPDPQNKSEKQSEKKESIFARLSEGLEKKPYDLKLPRYVAPEGVERLTVLQIIEQLLAAERRQIVLSFRKKKLELIFVGQPSQKFLLHPVAAQKTE
jgi:hypothetical protein